MRSIWLKRFTFSSIGERRIKKYKNPFHSRLARLSVGVSESLAGAPKSKFVSGRVSDLLFLVSFCCPLPLFHTKKLRNTFCKQGYWIKYYTSQWISGFLRSGFRISYKSMLFRQDYAFLTNILTYAFRKNPGDTHPSKRFIESRWPEWKHVGKKSKTLSVIRTPTMAPHQSGSDALPTELPCNWNLYIA